MQLCLRTRKNSLSTYDFCTLYTTLPHNLIKDKLIGLVGGASWREGSPYLACGDGGAFFASEEPGEYNAWSCQNVCDALTFLLDNIFYSVWHQALWTGGWDSYGH